VIPGDGLVLLDTGVIIHLIRNKSMGQRVLAALRFDERPERPLASRVSLGESLALAQLWSWGPEKKERLQDLLSEVVLVDLSFGRIPERYGDMAIFAQRGGHAIGQNDLWIAATAAEAGAHLVTTDNDFEPLRTHLMGLIIVPSN